MVSEAHVKPEARACSAQAPRNTTRHLYRELLTGRGDAQMDPRTARARARILNTAIEILARDGYAALSMHRLAVEAGASKQTLYRNWRSKEALVSDAVLSYVVEYPDPDTGSLRDDLTAICARQAQVLTSTTYGRALAAAYSAAPNSTLKRMLHSNRLKRREAMAHVIERGIERGEICPKTDIELLMDLLLSPAQVRIVLFDMDVDEPYVRRVVDAVINAFAGHPRRGCACD